MPKKLTTHEFISRARAVHRGKYDYSKVIYRNQREKITIICPDHGEFDQVAGIHIKGHNCPKCSGQVTLSNEQWIERAKKVHGGKYTYKNCQYLGRGCRVVVTCKKHGDFNQRAENHIRGDGCPDCGGSKRLTTDSFISKARDVHGIRYDYSCVEYIRNSDKVKIRCADHGFFMQRPRSHLAGQGCAHCAGRGSVTTDEFIRRSKSIHGELYTYEKVVYRNNKSPVCITCKKHGDFFQSPGNHVGNGNGCPVCFGTQVPEREEWVALARSVHGDRYDYSEVEYKNSKTNVKIMCKEHGYFFQTPNNHSGGAGCGKCAANVRLTTSAWLKAVRAVHGDRYDYSSAKYINSKSKVKVICRYHGAFHQAAGAHSGGQGCPKCFWNRSQPSAIYLMEMGELVKIGVSTKPHARIKQLRKSSPREIRLVRTWVMPDFPSAQQVESAVHRALSEYHAGLTGFDGATEWFRATPGHAAEVISSIAAGDPYQFSLTLTAA